MAEVRIELPYPPSVNHYKRVGAIIRTKTGKLLQSRVNTDATKRFYFEVFMRVRQEGLKSFAGSMIEVEIDLHSPDRRKRDIDNPIKPTLDALQKANVYDDDYQICRLLVRRMSIIAQGLIVVRIRDVT